MSQEFTGNGVLPDEAARRRIREDLDSTLFVEAAAGTGKTTALVSRIVSLLRRGSTTLDRVVAVTFTEKAAGELKLRIRELIEEGRRAASVSAEEHVRLDAALEHLELARLNTIHGFCSELLRERPVEAHIDPLFDVAGEEESAALMNEAFDRWFEHVVSDPPDGVRRVLRRRFGWSDGGPRNMLRSAVRRLIESRDFDAPWRVESFDRNQAIDRLVLRLEDVATLGAQPSRPENYLAKSFQEIATFVRELRLMEAVRGRDYDGLEAELRAFASTRHRHWRWTGFRESYGPDLSSEDALVARNGVKQELDGVLHACDADLAPRLREELRDVIASYEESKSRSGTLDFLDLLVRTRDLVRHNSHVRREFQQRYSHFFVDEFQDTDPLQVEILLLLASEDPDETDWRKISPVPGKLFIVGDPKQSIYRFRRADVAMYEEVKRQLLVTGAELVHLKASFRGRPSIQALVNAAFEPAMRGNDEGSQAEYVPLEAVRPEIDTRPTVVVLPVPRPYVDYGNRALITRRQISASFPDAVGAFVEWLLERSGWTIEEPGQSGVVIPIRARHVCILFRNLKSWNEDVTRPYVRALEARRLPHVLVGGRSFYEREEVLAIRNALMAIEWPDDDLRVFATLRGPFFALTDDSLLAFRHTHRSLHPLRWLDDDRREALAASDRDVAEALEIVAHLHVQRNRHPIAQTIERLLGATRAHAGIAIWPTGEQALANCFRTVDLARRFERRGSPSFRAFVEYLEDEAERGESRDAPVVEEGTEGVRMMTVHKAKGLEFPIVILADPTCNATSVKPSRHVVPERGLWAESLCGCVPPDLRDAEAEERCRDLEEAVRVAYVAATRARDLLVIPGIGDLDANDERTDGWLEALGPTMYPVRETRRRPEPSPGCPAFGSDSTYERPVSCSRDATASVAPGLHRSAPGGSAITWWDPAVLRLDTQEAVGLRQQRILHADKNATSASETGIENHEKWQKRRLATLETGSVPSLRVQAITGVAAARATPREDLNRIQVVVDETLLDGTARPHGRRFGILIHAVVATVDLDADRAGVEAATRIQGRLLGASEDEVAAAADAVEAALTHELLRSAADAARKGNIRRETPVLLRLEDGALGEGVIDLAFREGSTWTLVDFKTDRELAHNRQRYETQVQLYAHAIREATAEEVKAVLLLV